MKNRLLKYIKRGFGAVEVVLLLTVVAVIATFAFITIDQIKKKPITYTETNTVYVKDNADYLTVNDINTQLKGKKYSTVHETVKYLETKGYAIGKLKPQDKTYEFVYLQTENLFGILQNKNIIYPDACITDKITPNVWRFTSNSPSSVNVQYSYYLLDSCEGSVSSGGGVDVGNNEDITNIYLLNNSYSGIAKLRTTTITTSLTVRLSKGEVEHYGLAGKVEIEQVSFNSYHEYGRTAYLVAKNGKIVAKNGGLIELVYVSIANVSLVQDGGYIEEAYCVSTDEEEATAYGFNNTSNSHGGNVFIEYTNPSTFKYYTVEEIIEMGNTKVETLISNLYYEGVLVTNYLGERQLLTLENFSKKTNSGYTYEECSIELVSDIDLRNVTNWTPINNFKGIFEGKGHSIFNLNIVNDSPSVSLGLFGSVGSGAVIKNLNLKGVNISASGNGANVGGLVGQAENSVTIENISIDETSSLIGANVGGIIGTCLYSYDEGQILLSNCLVSAKLVGNMAGGLISKIVNLENENEMQKGITTIENSNFNGQIYASNGKNNWAAGLIAHISGGDYNSKVIVNNTNVVSTGNIRSSSGNFTSAIFGSTIRYHLNDFSVNGVEITSPIELSGIQVSDTLVVAINKVLYGVTFSEGEELNKLPNTIAENKGILASSDMKSFGINGDFEENVENDGSFDKDVWYEIINVNLLENENFEFIVSDQFQYVGIDPSKMFENVEGQLQRKVYVAGFDEVNDQDIYKFDFFRFVETGTTEEDGWVNHLELGKGEYFDDPSEFVDLNLYEITTFYLGESNLPDQDDDDNANSENRHLTALLEDDNEQDNNGEEEPIDIEEKILIYLVSEK